MGEERTFSMSEPSPTASLESQLGYQFQDPALLREALTHPSYLPTPKESDRNHNQRLEFLGDAVLTLHLSHLLFRRFPDLREGELSQRRAHLARGSTLAQLARHLDLGRHLYLSQGEESTGGRERDNLLEDAFEALVGALFLDAGWQKTESILKKLYQDQIQENALSLRAINPKGSLQELLQAQNPTPSIRYALVREKGPDHNRTFTVDVQINGKKQGSGTASSKRKAEELAAAEALQNLQSPSPL